VHGSEQLELHENSQPRGLMYLMVVLHTVVQSSLSTLGRLLVQSKQTLSITMQRTKVPSSYATHVFAGYPVSIILASTRQLQIRCGTLLKLPHCAGSVLIRKYSLKA
jgi:hypothetical protein